MANWFAVEGTPLPLGVTWIESEQAYNFSLYSHNATAVTLLLYEASDLVTPALRVRLNYLTNKSGRMWHCRLPAQVVGRARFYAYAVEGPFDPTTGDRFDSDKVLFDPYARALYFPPGFSRRASVGRGRNDGRAPLGEIRPDSVPFDWGRDPRPRHTSDTVIYEMHVRGFTMRPNSGVGANKRGTYAGVVEKIPYLKDLGVTAVQLLPVFQYDPDEGGNYWGYMPLSVFALHQGYAAAGAPAEQLNEFRSMVKALHEADIEVILDVVYNHTAEGGADGPTYCYRGLDNSTYYLLEQDMSRYRDDAGSGNVLRSGHPAVRKLIVDSLSHWVREMHVDGFRFDLASILTRRSDGSVNLKDPPIIAEITGQPEFADLHLIAEAWDLRSYEMGRGFPGKLWLQWNDRFRDDVRAFVRGDPGMVGALMTRIYGSSDLFSDERPDAYHPYQSINYVTCHDGFCLYDLVAYDRKHNEANGHGNRDGVDDNHSWNCGWEGDIGAPPEVLALRRRQVKNFCALLFLSNGTPMFSAGDEFMHTQGGNNNPYNQDNETTWLDWDRLEQNRDVFRFFRGMIAFRKAHPSLGRSRFWREDVRWYGVGREVDLTARARALAFCLHGASQQDRDIYVMVNASADALRFTIQEGCAADWQRVVDTSLPSPLDYAEPDSERTLASLEYLVEGRSVVVLLRTG